MRRYRYRSRAYRGNYLSRLNGRRYLTRGVSRNRRIRRTTARIARRRVRPERKWIDVEYTSTGENTRFPIRQFQLNPQTVTQGTEQFSRIGNKIMFRRMNIRFSIAPTARNDINATGNTVLMRVIIWTPRLTETVSSAHIATLDTDMQYPDYNVVNVKFDKLFRFVATSANGTTAPNTLGPTPGDMVKGFYYYHKSMPFLRVVDFIQGSNAVSDDKDKVFITFFINNITGPDTALRIQARTYFVDP